MFMRIPVTAVPHRPGRTVWPLILMALSLSAVSAFAFRAEKEPETLRPLSQYALRQEPTSEQFRLAQEYRGRGIYIAWNRAKGTPRSVRRLPSGTPLFVSAGLAPGQAARAARVQAAFETLSTLAPLYRFQDPRGEFWPRQVWTDSLGHTHVRLGQMRQGVRVEGAGVIVHFDGSGRVYEVNGDYVADARLDLTPKLERTAILRRVRADIESRGWTPDIVRTPAELVVFAIDRSPVLAWSVAVEAICKDAERGLGVWKYWVDAGTGEILLAFNDVKAIARPSANGIPATITGNVLAGEGGAVASVTGWRENSSAYYLYSTSAVWYVYNSATSGYPDSDTYAYRGSSDWGNSDPTEMSAGRNMDVVMRYFWERHGRESFDDNRATARVNVHVGVNYVNAYWDGVALNFGDGDGTEAQPLAVLDVCAHEFTHAVTDYSAALLYYGESGALSESFSDIFAVCVEFYGQPDGRSLYPGTAAGRADWLAGEDCWMTSKALRDLRNPSNTQTVGAGNELPTRYKGAHWYFGFGDNRGVHNNMSVQSFFFYLLSEGGSGNNDGLAYNVAGLGVQNAERIAYRALTTYCTELTDYDAARTAWLSAAADLNPAWTNAVAAAWDAVGVGPVQSHVASPVFTPPEGAYTNDVIVSLQCATPGAAIHYTVDGSDPTENSSLYSSPITISSDTTVKAKAFKTGVLPSDTVEARYFFLGRRLYASSLDESPHWAAQGLWAFGTPAGAGGQHGMPDPSSGYTGASVYGYNLAGDYPGGLTTTDWLTSQPVNLSAASDVKLVFRRWLGVERPAYDHAYVEVSRDGGNTWTRVWENTTEVADAGWTLQVLDISPVADRNTSVAVRWGMGPTDANWNYCGWNLDDIELWGRTAGTHAPAAPEDLQASAISGRQVVLTWLDKADNEQGFAIERKEGDGNWGEVARTGANTTQFEDTSVKLATAYTYRIRAFTPTDQSEYSNTAQVTTPSGDGDRWDPNDDTGLGATEIAAPTVALQSHGQHSLSATDPADWFKVYLLSGVACNFNSAGGSGDLCAELFRDPYGLFRVAYDDDSGGDRQFSLTYKAAAEGWHYLRVRTYEAQGAAAYALNYRVAEDGSAAPLAPALDASNLVWGTEGSAMWFSQDSVNFDGHSAAQSGAITHGQSSTLKAELAGPGLLRFAWKVSSEKRFDTLTFSADGVLTPVVLSGTTDWTQEFFYIPSGVYTAKWAYAKDESMSAGMDAGWVDQVVWTPDPQTVLLTRPDGATTLWILDEHGVAAFWQQLFDAISPWGAKDKNGDDLLFQAGDGGSSILGTLQASGVVNGWRALSGPVNDLVIRSFDSRRVLVQLGMNGIALVAEFDADWRLTHVASLMPGAIPGLIARSIDGRQVLAQIGETGPAYIATFGPDWTRQGVRLIVNGARANVAVRSLRGDSVLVEDAAARTVEIWTVGADGRVTGSTVVRESPAGWSAIALD